MERDCCKFICGAPTTSQGYGIEKKKKRKVDLIERIFQRKVLLILHVMIGMLSSV